MSPSFRLGDGYDQYRMDPLCVAGAGSIPRSQIHLVTIGNKGNASKFEVSKFSLTLTKGTMQYPHNVTC